MTNGPAPQSTDAPTCAARWQETRPLRPSRRSRLRLFRRTTTPPPHQEPRMAGESDFINWVSAQSQAQSKASGFVLVPPGDDLAVLKWPADDLLLVGVDQVLDGVHFDSLVHAPRAIGRKAMNRN